MLSGSDDLGNSVIIGTIVDVYKRFMFYYNNSGFSGLMERLGQSFVRYASGSSILGFFNREWNIGGAWKRSFIFKVIISPLKLLKYTSHKLSDGTNSTLYGSKALNGIRTFLEGLFNMSSRVYGLLFLTFALVQGLLDFTLNNGGMVLDMKGIIRLALFLLGTMLILINRPVKSLGEGSIVGGIVYDFFTVRGLKNGTNDKV